MNLNWLRDSGRFTTLTAINLNTTNPKIIKARLQIVIIFGSDSIRFAAAKAFML